MHCWADLQSVHRPGCCDNNAKAKCHRVLVLALCLVVSVAISPLVTIRPNTMVVMQTQDAEIEELKSTLEHLQQKSETSSGDVTSPIATTPHHCTSASSPAALATCISLQGNKHSHLMIVCVYGEVKIGRVSVFVESVAGIPPGLFLRCKVHDTQIS